MSPEPDNNDPSTRDRLAVTRTQLANERTLLAYLRTAIMLAATGVTALKLYPGETVMVAMGWSLLVVSGVVAAVGSRRFQWVSRGLQEKASNANE